MIGIVLASHGEMANGILDTTKLFFGEQKQLKAICLKAEDNPENFLNTMKDAIAEVDTGDGALVFVDMLYGTPCNCSAQLLSDKVSVVTGMNLSMIMEVLGARENSEIDVDQLIATAKDSIINLKTLFQ